MLIHEPVPPKKRRPPVRSINTHCETITGMQYMTRKIAEKVCNDELVDYVHSEILKENGY